MKKIGLTILSFMICLAMFISCDFSGADEDTTPISVTTAEAETTNVTGRPKSTGEMTSEKVTQPADVTSETTEKTTEKVTQTTKKQQIDLPIIE